MPNKIPFQVIESRQMDHLRVFHDVARALTSTLELEEILLAIMTKMAGFFGPERWSLLMVDEETGELYYEIAVGEDAESLKGLRVKMGDSVAGWVAQTGNPLVVPDVSLDPHWSAFARRHPELQIHSMACVPVRSANKTLGVIQLLNSKLDLLSEYSISFLRILCDYAAIAIQNANSMKLIHLLSITDDCTGLYNARHLYSLMDECVLHSHAAGGQEFSLLFMDLDRFKGVNDTHGHLVGSKLLAEVGKMLKKRIKPGSSAFRYGGDEFVVLMPGVGKDEAVEITKILYSGLRETVFLENDGIGLRLTGSFGLATFPEDGGSVHAMLQAADRMMYAVKNAGRDKVSVAGTGFMLGNG
ncbi:diguanylate cyclase with GAF sensor [Granulicella pectinivorans]|jgi:diguanylate cyclase (GGDEF)-like protein|uniref:diguanylate cyclase n=1 Tax=Granulicella pectinivorans TaxID=474950 RepID=A0A1I6L990_9BACT|nr:sensor domain-containing diguanylate cyclase [Granulicella pectinivorans]SFS00012.1 diguanylate cyclase with GAF sensor [Granulicella pectinivorans]